MKKLIMLMAVVAAVCSVRAASAEWGIANLFNQDYESLVGTVTMASVDGTFSSGAVAIDDAAVSGTFTDMTWGSGAFAKDAEWKATLDIQGDDGNMYSKVFDFSIGTVDTSDDRANAAMFDGLVASAYDDFLPEGVLDISSESLLAAGFSKSSGGVPEPTSGLLLVLGGAMLALRRRRA